jgi:hypothetical protein
LISFLKLFDDFKLRYCKLLLILKIEFKLIHGEFSFYDEF